MDNSYPWNGKRCRKGYKVNKTLKRCVSTSIPLPKPAPAPRPVPRPVPKPDLNQIIQVARHGTKCPATFKYNKTTKMCEKCPEGRRKVGRNCVLDGPLPKPVPKPAPVPLPKPAPVPLPKPAPAPDPIRQIIQITRHGTKCPSTFKYNKTTKMCEKCPDKTRKVGRNCILLPTEDKIAGPVDPEPLIVLPKPPPAGEPLVDFINRLEDTGKKVDNPKYIAGRFMVFVYIYLIKKYSASCSIFNDAFRMQTHGAAINYNISTKTLSFSRNLTEQMHDCVMRGSELIFITLYMFAPKGAHVNLLIYRPFKKIVERYEPHGQETGWGSNEYSEYDLNKQLKQLFEQTIAPVMKEYTPVYRTPLEICPLNRNGFQGIENMLPQTSNEEGYCQMWSMFMMETILLNPTVNTQTLIENCIAIGKNDPSYFKNVIRGYTNQIAREIKLYLKEVKLDIGTVSAHRALMQINIEQLINDTFAETKKRSAPLPALGNAPAALTMNDVHEIEKEVEKLNSVQLQRYINFFKARIITVLDRRNEKEHREVLLKLMLGNGLKWNTMIDNIYNTYFTDLSSLASKKIDYFLRFEKYPQPTITLNGAIMKNRMQLIEETKAKYPEWNKFFENLTDAKYGYVFKDNGKVKKDVAKLKPKQVSEFLFLLRHMQPASPADLSGPLFEKSLEKQNVETLIRRLQKDNLHIVDLQNWLSMF